MLTLEGYKAQTGRVQPFNEQDLELAHIGNCLAKKLYNTYSLSFPNSSQVTLSAFAEQALKSGKLPEATHAFTKTEVSFWTVRDKVAHKESTVLCKIHQLASKEKVISRDITKDEFNRLDHTNPRFEIDSSNIPDLPYPHLYIGHDVIKYFRDAIQSTAPHLVELMSVQWRHEGIHLYQEKEVNFSLRELAAKGFAVDIQAPYITVDEKRDSDGFCINSHQSISVRIPEGSSIEEKAVYEKHSSYKESLSVHNVLVAWRDTPEKISLSVEESHSKITVEQVLEQISKELAFVASQDSLIKRYAFDIALLESVKQQQLLEQLKELGYNATLDAKFIRQQFVGILNGFHNQFSRQYILIDLP